MTKVIIHPHFDAVWSSYFMKGLIDLYGFSNIKFSKKGFPAVRDASDLGDFGFMYFIIDDGKKQVKYALDAMDSFNFVDTALEWCDVYAKVNTDPNVMPAKDAYKVTPCSPHFPIRIGSIGQIVSMAFRTFDWGLKSYKGHFKKHIYRALKYGREIETFTPVQSKKGYVFLSTTYWKKNTDTNVARMKFMRAAKSIPGVTFEGGFLERNDKMPSIYPDLDYPRPTKDEYLQKVNESIVAYTSPSVYGAHSFRIAEYLAMGKCIMAPPIERLTTTPLVHGEHVHIVEPEQEPMRAAIEMINNDDAYRLKLEQGARKYHEDYGRPVKMMGFMIARGEEIYKQGKTK